MPGYTFDSYKLFYFAHYSPKANLDLYDGERKVGTINFYAENEPVPGNVAGRTGVRLNYPISDFSNIMSIFLHEKPLGIVCNKSGAVGFIYTGKEEDGGNIPHREPIGEQDVSDQEP